VSEPSGSVALQESDAPVSRQRRIVGIDVVRGFSVVILLIAVHPGPRDGLPLHLGHPEWVGLTFADTIFPLFLFAVGASMPFSRRASTPARTIRRVVLLTLIGIGLVSLKRRGLVLPGVLQHIALSYLLAWLILRAPRRWQVPICAALVAGVWAAFVIGAPSGVDPWGREDTFAHAVNEAVFGRFATEGIPQTVISTVAVMAGAIAGRLVKESRDSRAVFRRVLQWGLALAAIGLAMAPWVPVVKKLWSPSFAVLTAGTSLLYFAIALWLVDLRGYRRLAQPFVELGSNAIAIYVFTLALGALLLPYQDELAGPLDERGATVTFVWATIWLTIGFAICRWLYRRRYFIKV